MVLHAIYLTISSQKFLIKSLGQLDPFILTYLLGLLNSRLSLPFLFLKKIWYFYLSEKEVVGSFSKIMIDKMDLAIRAKN